MESDRRVGVSLRGMSVVYASCVTESAADAGLAIGVGVAQAVREFMEAEAEHQARLRTGGSRPSPEALELFVRVQVTR